MQHLENNNFLYDLQHGFRRGRSCESQLLSLVHKSIHNHDSNIQSEIILMDFAKAFDKVPHKRLLYKLLWYGIRRNIYQWIKSFLSDRLQKVIIDGTYIFFICPSNFRGTSRYHFGPASIFNLYQ